MIPTELEKAVARLVAAARSHSQIILGDDEIDLPADASMMLAHEQINAVAAYLEDTI